MKGPFRGRDEDHSAQNKKCGIAWKEMARFKELNSVGSYQAWVHIQFDLLDSYIDTETLLP